MECGGVVVWWCGRGEKRWCSSGALEYHPTAPPPHRKDTPEPHILPEGNNDNNSPEVQMLNHENTGSNQDVAIWTDAHPQSRVRNVPYQATYPTPEPNY